MIASAKGSLKQVEEGSRSEEFLLPRNLGWAVLLQDSGTRFGPGYRSGLWERQIGEFEGDVDFADLLGEFPDECCGHAVLWPDLKIDSELSRVDLP